MESSSLHKKVKVDIMKTVLITGASGGIGAATARRFAAEGYRVALHYYKGSAIANQLAEELGGIALQADLGDSAQVGQMVQNLLAQVDTVDALVCTAGIAKQQLFTHTTDQEWRQLFSVNVDGTFFPIRALLPHMIGRKEGRIITMASMWGEVGASCEVAYSATKGAIIAMTKALAKEVGPSGITVNCVSPGVIDTPMNGNLSKEDFISLQEETPLGTIGTPEDIANCIYFLASKQAKFMTGQVLSPNGGLVI